MAGRPQHQPDRLFARPSLLPDLELAPKAAPSAGREPLPMPEMETGPAPTSLSFDGKPGSAVPASELLNLKERPKSYKSLILNIIFAILTVILLAGAGYFIYTRVLPKTDTTLRKSPPKQLLPRKPQKRNPLRSPRQRRSR